MVYLTHKTKYKLSHTIPHNWATLRDSLVALLRGFVLLIKQTITMKKIIFSLVLLAVLVPSLAFAGFDVSLKYGSRGDTVSELQDFLTDQGFLATKIDGKFGFGTLKAVKAFQTAQGLTPDGYFGKASRDKANVILASLIGDSDKAAEAEGNTTTFPDGCTSTTGFSSSTGQRCDGTIPAPKPVIDVAAQNQLALLNQQVTYLNSTVNQISQSTSSIAVNTTPPPAVIPPPAPTPTPDPIPAPVPSCTLTSDTPENGFANLTWSAQNVPDHSGTFQGSHGQASGVVLYSKGISNLNPSGTFKVDTTNIVYKMTFPGVTCYAIFPNSISPAVPNLPEEFKLII